MKKINYLTEANLLKKNRKFKKLWLSRTVSFLGDSMYNITLSWYIFSKTGSALQVGIILVAKFLPELFFGISFGVLVDRYNKKNLMRLADSIQAIITLIFTILVAIGSFNIFEIFIINIFLSLAGNLFGTSVNSWLPELVNKEDLVSANSFLNISRQISNLVGTAIGGVLVASIGEMTSIFIDSLTFLISFLFVSSIQYNYNKKIVDNALNIKKVFSEAKEGASWLKNQMLLVILIFIGTLLNIALGPTNILSAMLVRKNFHGNSFMFSLFDALIGLGLLLGGMFIAAISPKKIGMWFLGGIFCQTFGMFLIFISPYFFVACTGNFILGFGVTCATIPMSSLFQMMIPADIRGRVNSISSILFNISIPITYGFVGMIADIIGAKLCYGISFIILCICIIIGFKSRELLNCKL